MKVLIVVLVVNVALLFIGLFLSWLDIHAFGERRRRAAAHERDDTRAVWSAGVGLYLALVSIVVVVVVLALCLVGTDEQREPTVAKKMWSKSRQTLRRYRSTPLASPPPTSAAAQPITTTATAIVIQEAILADKNDNAEQLDEDDEEEADDDDDDEVESSTLENSRLYDVAALKLPSPLRSRFSASVRCVIAASPFARLQAPVAATESVLQRRAERCASVDHTATLTPPADASIVYL